MRSLWKKNDGLRKKRENNFVQAIFVLLMGVENQYIDLNSQIIFLKEKNLLPPEVASDFKPNEPLRKGLFAYMLYRALDMKGGIILSLFGTRERYALKELVYQGILSSGNVKDIMSGDELVTSTMRAADFIANKKTRAGTDN
jgi:hypothetical protein